MCIIFACLLLDGNAGTKEQKGKLSVDESVLRLCHVICELFCIENKLFRFENLCLCFCIVYSKQYG